MKTTNYEISKQLAEAGFEAEAHHKLYCFKENTLYSYYDLETILEALPNFIANKNKGENYLIIDCLVLLILRCLALDLPSSPLKHRCQRAGIFLSEIHYEGDSDNDAFITTTQENESLVDTAAKLWLKLKKEGLV